MSKVLGIYRKDNMYVVDKVYKLNDGGERLRGKFKTKKEALAFINESQIAIDERINDGIAELNKKYAFIDLFHLYAKQHNWSTYTFNKNYRLYLIYFADFNNHKLSYIDSLKVQLWYEKILDMVKEKRFQYDYGKRLIKIMKGCINIGYDLGCFKKRINLSFIKTNNTYLESKKNPLNDTNYITKKELDEICDKVYFLQCAFSKKTVSRDDFCFILKFLFYTGCRINEARAIKIKDIIRTKETLNGIEYTLYKIEVSTQLEDNTIIHKPVKGKQKRFVYILEEFQSSIDTFIKKKKLKSNDYLFDVNKSGMPLPRVKIHRTFTKYIHLLKENGLINKNFIDNLTPHGLRYSNTLYFEQIGIPLDISSMNRGHTQMVMCNIYERIDKEYINNNFTYEVDEE